MFSILSLCKAYISQQTVCFEFNNRVYQIITVSCFVLRISNTSDSDRYCSIINFNGRQFPSCSYEIFYLNLKEAWSDIISMVDQHTQKLEFWGRRLAFFPFLGKLKTTASRSQDMAFRSSTAPTKRSFLASFFLCFLEVLLASSIMGLVQP